MELTEKQEALRDYLLQKLGFKMDIYSGLYSERLYKIAPIYISLASVTKMELDEEKQLPYFAQKHKINADGELEGTGIYVPRNFGIVDLLMIEYKYKKSLSFKILTNQNKYYSATDLANFIFCPVGFSISRTYDQINNELAEIGTSNHEKKILENRKIFEYRNEIRSDEVIKSIPFYVNDDNRYFFNEIADSQLIYSGHTENEDKKYFINEEKNFVGQPDYIFKSKQDEYFVVEEKFKVTKEDTKLYFADSHRVQLATYIHYLQEYNIKYGYLVYWVYSKDRNGYMSIDNCLILKINKESKIEVFLDRLINRVDSFIQKKNLLVDVSKLNPKKCASCVHMLMCGHKTQRFSSVSIPYSNSYLKLYYSPYPDILKKNTEIEFDIKPPEVPIIEGGDNAIDDSWNELPWHVVR